jgi:hypothetical protein
MRSSALEHAMIKDSTPTMPIIISSWQGRAWDSSKPHLTEMRRLSAVNSEGYTKCPTI